MPRSLESDLAFRSSKRFQALPIYQLDGQLGGVFRSDILISFRSNLTSMANFPVEAASGNIDGPIDADKDSEGGLTPALRNLPLLLCVPMPE
jgi:hypothetical protein